eukprot:Amastigsp_a841954_10.p4 type:complete len:185 gc:universal Amastigsp_a841954_10:129-683(+)
MSGHHPGLPKSAGRHRRRSRDTAQSGSHQQRTPREAATGGCAPHNSSSTWTRHRWRPAPGKSADASARRACTRWRSRQRPAAEAQAARRPPLCAMALALASQHAPPSAPWPHECEPRAGTSRRAPEQTRSSERRAAGVGERRRREILRGQDPASQSARARREEAQSRARTRLCKCAGGRPRLLR